MLAILYHIIFIDVFRKYEAVPLPRNVGRLLEGSSVVPVFKNVGERFTAKNYRLVSLFSVVSNVLLVFFLWLVMSVVSLFSVVSNVCG